MENILINFSSDPEGLQPGIDALDQLKESDKAVADQAKKTMDAYSKRDKTISDGSKISKKSIDDLSSSVKNLDKSMVGGIGGKALNDLRNSIKLTDGQWKTFYQNLIKNAKQELVTASQKEDIEQLNQLINGAKKALKEMGEAEDDVNKKSQSMKAQLRQLKQELQQLEDEGKDNTAEFERMAIKAGQLEDQIGDTNARIKALSSDTFVFDALISGVSGLTGAFAVGQGVMALYGDESEEVQQALLKVNAAMSILQGLQAIQNVLQKQSAASIGIDILLRRNQAAATTAQTLATEAQTGATVAATTAQKGLNLAWLASPAGILVTGIAAITAALFAFGSASDDAKEETDKLNESLERQNELLNELSGDSFAAKIARLRLRQKGATDDQLFNFDVAEERRKLEELKGIQAIALKDRADFEEKIRKTVVDVENKFGTGGLVSNKALQDLKDQTEERAKIYNEKVKSANEAVAKQEEAVQLLQAERDVEIFEDAQKKKEEAEKDALQKSKELREKHRKEQYENDLAAARSAQARTEALIIKAKKGSEEELSLKLKALDQGYYADILVRGKTVGELEKIDAQYYADRQELIKQYQQKEAQDAVNARIAQANSELSQLSLPSLEKNYAAELKAKKRLIDAQSDLDAQSVRNSEANEELRKDKIKAIYNKALADKRQLERDKTQAEINSLLDSQLSTIERERSKSRRANAKNPDSDKAFEEEMKIEYKIIDSKRTANFNLLSAMAIDNDEFRRRENEIQNREDQLAIQREQRKQDKLKQVRELALNSAIQLTQFLFDVSNNGYSKEQQQVRDLYDQKRISQTEYDNRTRQLRQKQAQDEKTQAIFSTLLQQGPAVLEGFKKGGFAGVAAAFALFFTMLNAVTSTEVPKFRYGGEIDGPGTGTSDSIPVMASKGEFITRYEQTQKHKQALKAINEDRFDSYLRTYEMPRLYQNMSATGTSEFSDKTSSSTTEPFDYDRMAGAFADKLAENPQTVLSFDEGGMYVSIRKGNQTVKFKNKKLSA